MKNHRDRRDRIRQVTRAIRRQREDALLLSLAVDEFLRGFTPTNGLEATRKAEYHYRLVPACKALNFDEMLGLVGGLLTLRGMGFVKEYDHFAPMVKMIQDFLYVHQLPLARDLWDPDVTYYEPTAL